MGLFAFMGGTNDKETGKAIRGHGNPEADPAEDAETEEIQVRLWAPCDVRTQSGK